MEAAPVFEWDKAKATRNRRKHGVSFEVASRAFGDAFGLDLYDDREEYGEDRWTRIGTVESRLLSVTWTPRGEAIRIVSARRANGRERKAYHG